MQGSTRQHVSDAEIMEIAKQLALGAQRATCGMVDREEALSAALEAVADALRTYRPRQGASCRTWLLTKGRWRLIEILHATGHVIRRKRVARAQAQVLRATFREADIGDRDTFSAILASLPARPPWVDGRPDFVALLERCHRLAPVHKALLVMRYVEDAPWAEIAARLGVCESTAHARHRRAKELLRQHLDRTRAAACRAVAETRNLTTASQATAQLSGA